MKSQIQEAFEWWYWDYYCIAGFILAVFVAGVAVGKLVEKVERHIHKKEDEEHRNAQKNNRR